MPFDQPTRNLLARFVGDARALLTEEFTRQLQQEYGFDPERGEVIDLSRLGHLDDARRATALLLRETLAYYLASQPKPDAKAPREALDRIVREQAFTILNRLCALRMAEGRGLLIESVGLGYRSKGFQLYDHLAGTGLGETGDAYRCHLLSLFDELALELPVLFDRYAAEGRLFPREAALSQVLALINDPEIAPLWAEDETIGWIYQYFNSVEERRQMRAESAAPRNSRELAVRNQFFTPRYVVEFLTDNTLGRIWYEMTRGETDLKVSCRYLVRRPTEVFLAEGDEAPQQDQSGEDLSQEELLRQPVYIPHRPLKDPRDILMLDPACGSLHFGLYAFDLYERIYDEAWELEGILGPAAFIRSEGFLPLRESYPDKAAFLADVPRLIIERNIHGIDIDPRAVQIAGLSLWLRAQRSWQAQGIGPQDRPQIRRSNIVCAEPMPGDRVLLEEFLKTLRDERLEGLIRRVLKTPAHQRVRATPAMADALCDLVRTVWKEMALAGEAGSLLKIEEALEDAVARGKAEWDEKMPLFRVVDFGLTDQAAEKPTVRYYKTVPGEDADFWDRAEALVLAALQDYAEHAENGDGYRRRLFASDAARGFAFIDSCRKTHDVILMNPPFGEAASTTEDYLQTHFPEWNFNLFCCFVARALERACFVGAITDRAYMLKTSYEDYRRKWQLGSRRLCWIVDLGWGVLDANVEVNLQVFQPDAQYVEIQDLTTKGEKISMELMDVCTMQRGAKWIIRTHEYFEDLPNAILSYALPLWQEVARNEGQNITKSYATAYSGLKAGQVERFVRLLWEVPEGDRGTKRPWSYFQNGSPFAPYYYPTNWVISYEADWRHIRIIPSSRITGLEQYWRPGLTYGKRTDRIYCYPMPEGQVFSNEGMAVFPRRFDDIFSLMAFVNSPSCQTLMNLLAGQHKAHSYFNKIWLRRSVVDEEISNFSRSIIQNLRRLDSTSETSLSFVSPFFTDEVSAPTRSIIATTAIIGDQLVNEVKTWYTLNAQAVGRYLNDDTDDEPKVPDWPVLFFELPWGSELVSRNILSYAIGASYGRWNAHLSSQCSVNADLLDPFAPLPACPAGMLQSAEGLPATPADIPANYPLRISWQGILVDEEGHREDIEGRVRDTLRVIWPDTADAIEQEACQILSAPSLRHYLCKPSAFFDDHLKRYSKSRRQAPIYWPLSTPSGSYTLWLYYHRLTDQMLYTCVNDFVDPKLTIVCGRLAVLRRKSGRSREEERELEQLTDQEAELKDFRAELLRIAAFWKPNLNDGVQITAAPLWRLFQHRPWQKTLKETYEKLEAGEYDWAHLAISIWPERVVPKCVTDRSLAIAHDVEDLFWVEDGGRWRNLDTPDEELAEQVRRQQRPGRDQLRSGLAALTMAEGRGLRCEQVYEALTTGKWDDLTPAFLLWPERVAKKCWDDPLLAVTLKIDLPTKRTKAARERFIADRVAAGCPDLADALREALADRVDRFASLWAELARGDRDELALALALWPERVVDKCAKDVELAERHGIRRFLWVQDQSGAWRLRKALKDEITSEIARR